MNPDFRNGTPKIQEALDVMASGFKGSAEVRSRMPACRQDRADEKGQGIFLPFFLAATILK